MSSIDPSVLSALYTLSAPNTAANVLSTNGNVPLQFPVSSTTLPGDQIASGDLNSRLKQLAENFYGYVPPIPSYGTNGGYGVNTGVFAIPPGTVPYTPLNTGVTIPPGTVPGGNGSLTPQEILSLFDPNSVINFKDIGYGTQALQPVGQGLQPLIESEYTKGPNALFNPGGFTQDLSVGGDPKLGDALHFSTTLDKNNPSDPTKTSADFTFARTAGHETLTSDTTNGQKSYAVSGDNTGDGKPNEALSQFKFEIDSKNEVQLVNADGTKKDLGSANGLSYNQLCALLEQNGASATSAQDLAQLHQDGGDFTNIQGLQAEFNTSSNQGFKELSDIAGSWQNFNASNAGGADLNAVARAYASEQDLVSQGILPQGASSPSAQNAATIIQEYEAAGQTPAAQVQQQRQKAIEEIEYLLAALEQKAQYQNSSGLPVGAGGTPEVANQSAAGEVSAIIQALFSQGNSGPTAIPS